ncbi:PEP-CTERM sorting domain-containing protein [Duganella sp. BJB475]|uniref:Npun_F0296 family exosortase-dependent surface protein n=1 Tax=Duganella sp. BJB475 TaxID=2233914 RepID=UPI000E3483E9|nr:PEP-CTERM sorting domain-containing protein [Duganella sp. BJB475]RFP10035.1 PEP-CTERM sorting domain-containing protein [Duganella sp. BJB475]
MSISKTLLALSLAGAAFSASAGVTYTATTGTTSGVGGVTTNTFDDGLLPIGFATYDQLGALIPSPGNSGYAAQPPGDPTAFFSVGISNGQPSSSSVTFGGMGVSYFGYYMGSPDDYNIVTMYSGNTMVLQINGNDMAAAAHRMANGNQQVGFYMNFFTDSGTTITKVTFSANQNAFESDNHSYISAVPEPEIFVMLLTGLGLLGLASRRDKAEDNEKFY